MSSALDRIGKSWVFWLILIVTLVYGPFFGFRVVRMAGDEKVYVSQALEMAAHGNWFLQRLQGVPDYYKGPLHYILLRLGLILFGKSAWAALYMNFVLLMAGAISIGALTKKYCRNWNGGPVWAGAFFATCVGVYTHSFASQMECELACMFAVALYLLDRAGEDSPAYGFWIMAGLIGWSKSPLHALLAGLGAVLYWGFSGQLGRRLKSLKCWGGVLTGIGVCTAGYLPAFLFDRANFISYYIVRETLSKGDSGQPWTVSFVSVLGFYLFPWLLLCLVAYAEAAWNLLSNRFRGYSHETRRALLLAACWVTPSFVFFGLHPYHFENYNLPVISGVILFICVIIGHRSARFNHAYRLATVLTAFLVLGLPVGLTALHSRFAPLPSWWPSWLVPFSWLTAGPAFIALIYFGWADRLRRMNALAIAMLGFYLPLGCTISVIGERELVGLRAYLHQQDLAGNHIRKIGYYNLQKNIWSEWGFLNLWTDRDYYEIHDPEKLKQDLLEGQTIIIPAPQLGDFRGFMKAELPGVLLQWTPWPRWRTQGKSPTGQPLWIAAWNTRDLSLLERDFYIVRKR